MAEDILPSDEEQRDADVAFMRGLAYVLPRERIPRFIETLRELEEAEERAKAAAARESMSES